MKSRIFIMLCFFFIHNFGEIQAQSTKSFSLTEIIEIAQQNSSASRQAQTSKKTSFWDWKVFQSSNKPQLTLDATFPSYNRSIIPVTQPDGSISYELVRNNTINMGLGLSQRINATGGTISFGSTVQRFEDFNQGVTQYNSTLFYVSLNQPIVGYNPFKWDIRVEPLRFRESEQQYIEAMEKISLTTTDYFFTQLIEQVNFQIAEINLRSNQSLYDIALEKDALGKISKNDLLQLKLEVIKSKKSMVEAKQNQETSSLKLKSYIGNPVKELMELSLPSHISELEIDAQTAIKEAHQNRSDIIAMQRKQVEAMKAVARAKGDVGPNISLMGAFGVSNRATIPSELLSNTLNQQTLQLQVKLPLMTWGRAKARLESAKASKMLTEYVNEQDKQIFDDQILTQAERFNILREQLNLSIEADTIASQRYIIAKDRFILGNLSVTDLTLALQEKDQSKRNYITTLGDFWKCFYNLRFLTLFDFEKKQKIRY
jgi:outer membrane protein